MRKLFQKPALTASEASYFKLDKSSLNSKYNEIKTGDGLLLDVLLIGKVVRRRMFESLLFLNVVIADINDQTEITNLPSSRKDDISIQLIISEEGDPSLNDTVKQLCLIDSVLQVKGKAQEGGLSNFIDINVSELTLLTCAPSITSIERVLEFVISGFFTISDACEILMCDTTRLHSLLGFLEHVDSPPRNGTTCLTASEPVMKNKRNRGELVAHSRSMQGFPPKRARQRRPHLSKADLGLLDSTMKQQTAWNPIQLCGCAPEISLAVKKLNIPRGDGTVPSTRGHMSRGEYFHGRKLPQCDWFVHQIRTLFMNDIQQEGSDSAIPTQSKPFHHILDIGGGRGDLGMHITSSVPNTFVTVVDTNAKSLSAGIEDAKTRGLGERMQFIHQDFVAYLDSVESSRPHVDLVVALHACGGLTDQALYCAAKLNSSFLICPCCYLKNQHLCNSEDECSWKHRCRRLFTTSSSDVLGVSSSNSRTSAALGDSSNEHMRTLMRLAESDDRPTSFNAMKVINNMRLDAIFESANSSETQQSESDNLEILVFPKEFSLRNMVLARGFSTQRHSSSSSNGGMELF